jgi:hypothetical protein
MHDTGFENDTFESPGVPLKYKPFTLHVLEPTYNGPVVVNEVDEMLVAFNGKANPIFEDEILMNALLLD